MSGFGTLAPGSQAVISLRAYLAAQGPTQQVILNYSSPDPLVAAQGNTLTITVAENTANQEINLPVLLAAFTEPVFISIAEVAQPNAGLGFKLSSVSAGTNPQVVGPNGFIAWLSDGATAMNPIYITNSNLTTELIVSIGVMSN